MLRQKKVTTGKRKIEAISDRISGPADCCGRSRSPSKPLPMEPGNRGKQNLTDVKSVKIKNVCKTKTMQEREVNPVQTQCQIEAVQTNVNDTRSTRSNRKLKNVLKNMAVNSENISDAEFRLPREIFRDGNLPIGDEVALSVHAPEDTFQSEDSDDEGVVNEQPIEQQNDRTDQRSRIEQMRQDPLFREMVNQTVAEQFKAEKLKLSSPKEGKETEGIKEHDLVIEMVTPVPEDFNNSRSILNNNGVIVGEVNGTPKVNRMVNQMNKSPSDMTIYAPAFAKSPVKVRNNGVLMSGSQDTQNVVIDNITQFLEQMRINSGGSQQAATTMNTVAEPMPGTSAEMGLIEA